MKFTEVASRVTGFSIPIFGISWQPPLADVTVAKKIIVFLEDRRVLFNPYHIEVPQHVFMSIIEIRHFLTDTLTNGGIGTELEDHIRGIRGACREFMKHDPSHSHSREFSRSNGFDDFKLNQHLGELRRSIGFHVAAISSRYGIDIESELATILPEKSE